MPGPSDILLIPLGLADPRRAFSFAAAATAGAVVGGLIAFAIGAYAFEEVGRPLLSFLGVSDATLERSRVLFERRGWMIVILSTVSPLPTKLVSIAAGAFGVPLPHFLFGITVGRAARFFAIAFLLRFAGERLTARIERSLGRSVARLN